MLCFNFFSYTELKYCRGTSKCPQSCWACPGVLKASCVGLALWASRNMATSVSMMCGFACTSLPVCLDHLFFTRPFVCTALPSAVFPHVQMSKNLVTVCTQLFSFRSEHILGDTIDVLCFHMRKPQTKTSLCPAFHWRKSCHEHTFPLSFFHMYKPESNFNSRQQRKFTVAARKKRNFLRSLLHLMAWSGPTDLKFEHGLLEVCTEGKPACQCSKTWSVPAMVNSLFGRLLWFCSVFSRGLMHR